MVQHLILSIPFVLVLIKVSQIVGYVAADCWHSHHTPPDLTPCDFWLRGIRKDCVYSKKVRDIVELKDRIKGVIANIPQEMCVKALNHTVDHWFLCINCAGGD